MPSATIAFSQESYQRWKVIDQAGTVISVLVAVVFFAGLKLIVGPVLFLAGLFPKIQLRRGKPAVLVLGLALLIWNVLFIAHQPLTNLWITLPGGIVLLAAICSLSGTLLGVPDTTEEITVVLGESWPYRWLRSRLRNPADLISVSRLGLLSLLIIPAFISILWPATFNGYSVLAYVAISWICYGAVSTLEHMNCHDPLFGAIKKRSGPERIIFKTLDLYTRFILNFMFARIPNWYAVQHVYIHHQEDNGSQDTQSTLWYDRASFAGFARCANRFAWSGLLSVDVIRYLLKKGRRRPLKELLTGMCFFYFTLSLISLWNWPFVLTILAVRYSGQLLATLGFFQEHGMVDRTAPQNIYRNSIHFISKTNTHASLGDDAHIEHHLHMGRHWTRYAADVDGSSEAYGSELALAYQDSPEGLNRYYRLLWCEEYLELAEYFVVFGQPDIPKPAIAALLWERTRPLTPANDDRVRNRLDNFLGRLMGHLLV